MHSAQRTGFPEQLILLLLETSGGKMTLSADANGYYEANEAIRVGKILEENKYAYFKEPVRYDDFEAIKRVADALDLPIANGEQDHLPSDHHLRLVGRATLMIPGKAPVTEEPPDLPRAAGR